MKEDGQLHSRQQFVEANSLADVIEYIESNAGWYTDINVAFKVAYIEEVVEWMQKKAQIIDKGFGGLTKINVRMCPCKINKV